MPKNFSGPRLSSEVPGAKFSDFWLHMCNLQPLTSYEIQSKSTVLNKSDIIIYLHIERSDMSCVPFMMRLNILMWIQAPRAYINNNIVRFFC